MVRISLTWPSFVVYKCFFTSRAFEQKDAWLSRCLGNHSHATVRSEITENMGQRIALLRQKILGLRNDSTTDSLPLPTTASKSHWSDIEAVYLDCGQALTSSSWRPQGSCWSSTSASAIFRLVSLPWSAAASEFVRNLTESALWAR